jgi:hypothetical protein
VPRFEDSLLGRLLGLLAGLAVVDRFAEEVGVAGVACCLLDEASERSKYSLWNAPRGLG